MPARPRYRVLETFLGPFAIIEKPDGSLATTWADGHGRPHLAGATLVPRLQPELAARLRAYFQGGPVDFAAWLPARGTTFQRRCWSACQGIRWGRTCSYAELGARAGGKPGAARAAGQAMRHNPLPVVVPCHRVVAASGRLHGFAGCCDPEGPELRLKAMLLEHERRTA